MRNACNPPTTLTTLTTPTTLTTLTTPILLGTSRSSNIKLFRADDLGLGEGAEKWQLPFVVPYQSKEHAELRLTSSFCYNSFEYLALTSNKQHHYDALYADARTASKPRRRSLVCLSVFNSDLQSVQSPSRSAFMTVNLDKLYKINVLYRSSLPKSRGNSVLRRTERCDVIL